METGYIRFSGIETDKPIIEVKIVDGTVWMTVNEIDDLFGVYTPTISKHLKAIFKDNLLRESDVTKEYRYPLSGIVSGRNPGIETSGQKKYRAFSFRFHV